MRTQTRTLWSRKNELQQQNRNKRTTRRTRTTTTSRTSRTFRPGLRPGLRLFSAALSGHRSLVATMFLIRTRTFCSKPLPVLTLFTKDPCPLCDEAKELLEPFRHRLVLQTVDISKPEHREFWDRYRFHIPVFHLNGTEIMRHRLDPERLDQLLNQDQDQKQD